MANERYISTLSHATARLNFQKGIPLKDQSRRTTSSSNQSMWIPPLQSM